MAATVQVEINDSQIQNMKFQILMVLPNRSSIGKIKKHFKVSNYVIWAAKKSVAVDGILSDQNVKPGTVSPIKTKMAEQFVSLQDHNRNI